MSKRGTVLLSMALAIGLTTTGVTAAHAAPCVSNAEYKKIHTGLTKAEVKKLTGLGGKSTGTTWLGDYYYESRMYQMCTAYRWAIVIYIDGKVSSKSKL